MPARTTSPETIQRFAIVLDLARTLAPIDAEPAAIRFRGHLAAWMPDKKNLEPGTLAVRIDTSRRDELIAEDPDIYYVTDHYLDYSTVLVRLSRIPSAALPAILRDLLGGAFAFVKAKPIRKPRSSRR